MRRMVILGVALILASCGQKPDEGSRTDYVAQPAAGPRIGVTRVPGVSLTYAYGFRLPTDRIMAVQEEHAARCERLTPARCRVTGMRYDVSDRRITAMLDMRLAPELARGFGRDGVDIVVRRGGMLQRAEISSEESGAAVASADRDAASFAAENQRIEAQLARPGLGSTERAQLQGQLADLANRMREAAAVRDGAQQKLASTPVTFNYVSGAVDPGLSDGPILGAIKDGWTNIVFGFAVILTTLITLLPWVLVGGLLVWLWQRHVRRLFKPKD